MVNFRNENPTSGKQKQTATVVHKHTIQMRIHLPNSDLSSAFALRSHRYNFKFQRIDRYKHNVTIIHGISTFSVCAIQKADFLFPLIFCLLLFEIRGRDFSNNFLMGERQTGWSSNAWFRPDWECFTRAMRRVTVGFLCIVFRSGIEDWY